MDWSSSPTTHKFLYFPASISINVNWAGWLIFLGIVFFSGSLYILALTQIKILGAITPIGGLLFIAGWLMLVIATIKL